MLHFFRNIVQSLSMPITTSIVIGLLFSCGNTDPRKIGEGGKRDTSSFNTSILGEWQGTLNELNGTNLTEKGQISLQIYKNDKFEASLVDRTTDGEVRAFAKGLYYVYGTDRIAFEATESDFYPHFSTEGITTMGMKLTGNKLELNYELDYGGSKKVSTFNLRLKERRQNNSDAEPQTLDLFAKCSGVDDIVRHKWIFQMTENDYRFEAEDRSIQGSVTMKGDCELEGPESSRYFRCLTKESSSSSHANVVFELKPSYNSDFTKVERKLITVSQDNKRYQFDCKDL